MLSASRITLVLSLLTSTFATPLVWEERQILHSRDNFNSTSSDLVVDLGKAGKWKGILQNNGTVQSWKGIAYAAPPVGELRYKGPKPLSDQSSADVQDVSDDALRCVQFGVSGGRYVGVKAGPGVEDCLKLWIWKPAKAKKGDKLPVHIYTHGGGLQNSAPPNNDFSDWVSQDQNFIAVNPAYRLGGLGFMASSELTDEGESANAGLLDSRAAVQWVVDNIEEFGGDPQQLTIAGQSGGGYSVASQLALYDGKKPNFQRAIARSVQRSPMFTIAELSERNDMYASLLNCTSGQSQLACFRNQSATALVDAANILNTMTRPSNNLTWGDNAFVPTVDGVTLTDHLTALFQAGKFSKNIPLIVGYVNDEAGLMVANNVTALTAENTALFNVTEVAAEIASYYPVNATFGDVTNGGSFFIDGKRAVEMGGRNFGDAGISGSERLLARTFSKYADPKQVYSFRFDAPNINTTGRDGAAYPLGYPTHSADNSYLQNATAIMIEEELGVALEFRAYIGSFVRSGDPNKYALKTAPQWYPYATLDYEKQPLRLVPAFAYRSSIGNVTTQTQMEVAGRAQLERQDFFTSARLQQYYHN